MEPLNGLVDPGGAVRAADGADLLRDDLTRLRVHLDDQRVTGAARRLHLMLEHHQHSVDEI